MISFEIPSAFGLGLCVVNSTRRERPHVARSSFGSLEARNHQPAQAAAPFSHLLVMELLLILAYPFTLDMGSRFDLFRLLAVLVFIAALYAALGHGKTTVYCLSSWDAVDRHPPGQLSRHLQVLADRVSTVGVDFPRFVTVGVHLEGVVGSEGHGDTLAGAIAAYLLVGITYGLAYGLMSSGRRTRSANTVEAGRVLHPAEFIFFSFVTLTTVGYGDIVPWGGHARSLVILESVTGIMYPAVLISRLIGLHISRRFES